MVSFLFLNISETIRTNDFKIYYSEALGSLYISTRNEAINYIRIGSKSYKRINFLSCSDRDFSMIVQPILKRFTVFETAVQWLHFHFSKLLDISAPWLPQLGLKWTSVVYALRRRLIAIFSLYFYALHKWLVLCCWRSQLAHASRCTDGHAWTLSEQAILASIRPIDDSRWCGIWRRVSHCPTIWWAFLFYSRKSVEGIVWLLLLQERVS